MERGSVTRGGGGRGKARPPPSPPPGRARPIPSLSFRLALLRLSLTDLEKGIQGLIVMSTSLEEIFNCIFDAHVPPLWGKARFHSGWSPTPTLSPLAPAPLVSWLWEQKPGSLGFGATQIRS